jgi:ATP-binding cassette subfamily C (CFTR/MRP) protein 4
MQARVSLISAIYIKALKLPLSSQYSSSQLTNLITADVQKFEDASGFFHFCWAGPLETLLVTFFLWQQIGIAAFAGIAVLLMMIPLQTVFAQRLLSARKSTNKFQDMRIKKLSDIFSGILSVKVSSSLLSCIAGRAYSWKMSQK